MRGTIGGLLVGGFVSAVGLGTASVISEQPAGVTPPAAPLVEAPQVDPVITEVDAVSNPVTSDSSASGPSTPVGSISIEEPQAPALPEGEASLTEPEAPVVVSAEADAPRADTDPLDEPEVASIEGAMEQPIAPDATAFASQPVDPVLPNPQSLAPQTPENEADLTVSTTPAQPTVVVEPEPEEVVAAEPEADVDPALVSDAEPADEPEETFVVDLGADAAVETPVQDPDVEDAPVDVSTDDVLAAVIPDEPRLQLQSGENTLLGDRETGVTVRRSTDDVADDTAVAEPKFNALQDYAVDAGDVGSKPLMSIVLIDDGTMSAAAAALSGLPFPVTIALDPATEGAAELMAAYRANGFEVAIIAKLPEGAVPTDVEITFESVFSTLPETVAVLDIGDGGLQSDRDVTAQAMEILASQGRGFVTVSQGLNMAGRAAEQAGVPSVVVYRDLDIEGQDARVVRRFVDQAAFRARQESGVVLVGRVRPDTISALILWGTANQGDQVAVVPVSAVLLAQ